MKQRLSIAKPRSYVSAAARGGGTGTLRPPSMNCLLEGADLLRAWRGPILAEGLTGAKIFSLTDQTFAGLGDADNDGRGSIFTVKRLLHFIGTGPLTFNGSAVTGVNASSTLSYVQKTGDDYVGPALQCGHAQPSAPGLFAKSAPSTGKTAITGAIAVSIWRVCSITGQVSLKSLTSVVVTLNNQTAIAQIPSVDLNGQDLWGIGVPKIGFADLGLQYELPISQGGEVAESDLAYTRSCGTVTATSASDTVTVAGGVTSADIGRRISNGTFDSWIIAIVDATHAQCFDTAGANSAATGTITHAIDGILRAVEIGYANGDLIGQDLAPDKAFPPPAGEFAGALNDVLFVEGDNIIYVGEPGFNGSFPPSNALFPNEKAVAYVPWGDGVEARIGKHSLGVLIYVGGSPALEFQLLLRNIGIQLPQNAALGAPGRLLLWAGRPVVLDASLQPDYEFAREVLPEFVGWAEQTAAKPVVPGYDPKGMYEVWCFGKKIMPFHVPTRQMLAPLDLTDKIAGDVLACVTQPDPQRLLLCCKDGDDLKLYEFDAGTGTVMVVQLDDVESALFSDTLTEIRVQARCDNTDENVKIEIVRNFDDDNPLSVRDAVPPQTGPQRFICQPNIVNAEYHAVRVTVTSQGGDAGIDTIETYGSSSAAIYQAA